MLSRLIISLSSHKMQICYEVSAKWSGRRGSDMFMLSWPLGTAGGHGPRHPRGLTRGAATFLEMVRGPTRADPPPKLPL